MTAEPVAYLPLVECMPWCDQGDGHPDQHHTSDQACWSPSEYVDLSLEPVHVERCGEFPQQIGVMARRWPDAPGHVYVHLQDIEIHGSISSPYRLLDHGLMLTVEEAERLAQMLAAAASMARSKPATD